MKITADIRRARMHLSRQLYEATNAKCNAIKDIIEAAIDEDALAGGEKLLDVLPVCSSTGMREIQDLILALKAFDGIVEKNEEADGRITGLVINMRDREQYDVAGVCGWRKTLVATLVRAGLEVTLEPFADGMPQTSLMVKSGS